MLPAIAILSGLAQFAPVLTRWLGAGDSIQTIADKASEVAQIVTGTADPESAMAALKADPNLVLQYQAMLAQQEKDFEALYVSDKNSARVRDAEFLKAGTRNYRADFLVGITVIIVALILAVVILEPNLNEFAKGVITTILGVFLNQLTNIFSFEFGTTRLKDKQDQTQFAAMTEIAKK